MVRDGVPQTGLPAPLHLVPAPRGGDPVAAVPTCHVSVVVPGARLAITGRLDVRAAADVRMALVAAVDAGHGELVVNVAGVTAVDATGLGVLVGAHRRAGRAGRTLVLRTPSPALARALLITRLDRVLRDPQAPVRR